MERFENQTEEGGERVDYICSQLKMTASDGKRYLTDKINDRDVFMKGIDYSYYYEEE